MGSTGAGAVAVRLDRATAADNFLGGDLFATSGAAEGSRSQLRPLDGDVAVFGLVDSDMVAKIRPGDTVRGRAARRRRADALCPAAEPCAGACRCEIAADPGRPLLTGFLAREERPGFERGRGKRMRKDAQEHRSRLLAAASRIFATSGCDAPLEQVLVEAGLGRGTLYRHFATRDELILAVLQSEVDRMVAFVDTRRGTPALLRDFLQQHAAVGMLAVDATCALSRGARDRMEPLQHQAQEMYRIVIAEAVDGGMVRSAFGVDDLLLITRMIVGAASQAAPGEDRERMISKGLDIVFEGLDAWQS